MSERVTPATAYLIQRFWGTLHPDDASLSAWINDRAAEGWRLIAVDQGVGYFEKSPPAVSTK